MNKTTIVALVVLFLLIFTAIGFAINKKVESKQAMKDELEQLKAVKPVVNNYYPIEQVVQPVNETEFTEKVNSAVSSSWSDMTTKYNCLKIAADTGEMYLTCDLIAK